MVDKIWYNMEELIGGSEERVLIETYWNVNKVAQISPEPKLSINRNILECKYDLNTRSDHSRPGINRNILECKYIYYRRNYF